eukprot:TRINITY_DN117_c0_g1_i2.p1 TRINITY_DN117_c0_g1~~TRINITY_DN117_c0_g1_i2.p1  ORF type:complete len:442 (-),score=64.55 TRINITY_DN117_c0_g1_i2:536-1747(-)
MSDVVSGMEGSSDEATVMWPLYALGGIFVAPVIFEFVYDKTKSTTGSSGATASQDASGKETMTKKPYPRSSAEALVRPAIAWPTVILATASMLGWSLSMYLFCSDSISGLTAYALSTVCAFASFTPFHDATHFAVAAAPRYRWLNEMVGHICGLPLLFPHNLFRHMHLLHHKHTNDNGDGPAGISLDPDRWAGAGPVALLPLRWATALLWYTYWAKTDYKFRKAEALRKGNNLVLSQLHELRDSCFGFWGAGAVALVLLWYCQNLSPMVCWVAPALSATCILMYVFDYVPHRPHVVPHRIDPYMATNVTSGPFGTIRELDFFLLSQNLHNIHHLFPQVPFYRYRTVWEAQQNDLLDKGTRVLPLFLLGSRSDYLKELQKPESQRPKLLGRMGEFQKLDDKKKH